MTEHWEYDPDSWWDADGPHTYVHIEETLWTKIKRGVSHWYWRHIKRPILHTWWDLEKFLGDLFFPFTSVLIVFVGLIMGIALGIIWGIQKKDPEEEKKKLIARFAS